jgi:hypothetical protein
MAAAKKKRSSRKKKTAASSAQRSWKRLGLVFSLWIMALGITFLGLIGVLLVPQNGEQKGSPQEQVSTAPSEPPSMPRAAPQQATSVREKRRAYEHFPQETPEPAFQAEPSPPSRPDTPQAKRPARSEGPCLAVVIDDMGQSMGKARQLLNILGSDLTWSILPYSLKTREVVQLAADNGLEYLLHIPMEPKGYPQVDPGPGSIFVDMSPEQIRTVLANNLDQVPGAVGANNHMGSRFTEDKQGMQTVLEEVQSRRLFFIDSLTSPRSKVKDLSRELNLPVMLRDVFLDNVQDVEAIIEQLNKSERLARQRGKAVAIGHPYPETLTALAKWSKERDTRVKLVPLSQLIAAQRASQE